MTTALREPDLSNNAARADEWYECRRNFLYWLRTYVKVMDKTAGGRVPFVPYPGQMRIVKALIDGQWVWLLKSRRLGATAIVLAYILHEVTFYRDKRVIMVSQDKGTAIELIGWYNDLSRSMPDWMQLPRRVDNTERIVLDNGSTVKVVAASSHTGRSLDCDILLVDEAAFAEYLKQLLAAAEPTLETGKGVAAVMSTSNGPGDHFEGCFWRAQGPYTETGIEQTSDYKQIFLSWRERPGRTDEWRAKKASQMQGLDKQEYPNDPVEAFEAGFGRVFPSFRRDTHLVHHDMPLGVKRYRALDFGSSPASAFVCLWVWHDPQSIPCLTFEPDCETIEESPETIGEFAAGLKQMVSYRRNDRGEPIKLNDDVCDALRYLVTTFRMHGHVHVYRMLFLRSADIINYITPEWGRRIMEMSGWVLQPTGPNNWRAGPEAEHYAASIGDKEGRGSINELNAQFSSGGFQMGITPYVVPKGINNNKHWIEHGIRCVNSLLDGQYPMAATKDMTPRDALRKDFLDGKYVPDSIGARNRVRRFEDYRKRGNKRGKVSLLR